MIIVAASVAALFNLPASCRLVAVVEGRGAAGSRCGVAQFKTKRACVFLTLLLRHAGIFVQIAVLFQKGVRAATNG